MSDTEIRYKPALELYRSTELSVTEICEQTDTPLTAFRSYLWRCHRELMFARHGLMVTKEEAATARLRKSCGQSAATHTKYKDAIEACDDMAYIEFNVSQIARMFHLNPAALCNQLRNHYPEIQKRREKARCRLGVNDNLQRGAKPQSKEQYATAVEHLRTSDDTIRQTANMYNLSYSGLREHLLYYHKDLIRERANKRKYAKTNKRRGALTGRGSRHEPEPQIVEKYREAIQLYRITAMTQEEICTKTGVTVMGLRHYLRIWNKELIQEHHNVDGQEERMSSFGMKHYLKSTAAKYAEAIKRLKATQLPTTKIAKEFGLNPETFRKYLYEHQPELADSRGMIRLENGRQVLTRCVKKYDEAVHLYATTTEPLKSIASRLGLQYNSVVGFMRRNHPDTIEAHKRLIEQEKGQQKREDILKQEKEQVETAALTLQKETEEKDRILQALKQAGGNKRCAAKLLGISKSTLYNKLNALNLIKNI